ncbi:MAG: nucleotidyltransferase domain-containing protein [Bacillota bacterium]
MARLSRAPAFINIDPFFPDLLGYFSGNKDIFAAYLYGSYGTAAQTPFSDVDLAVLLAPEADRTLPKQMEIEANLAKICHIDDINLLLLNDAPVLLQFKVISTGRLIFARDAEAVNDFQELVCKRYADFMPDYLNFCRDYDRSLREAYSYGGKGETAG